MSTELRMRTFTPFTLLALLLLAASCTPSETSPEKLGLKKGIPPLLFNPKEVSELLISKDDPQTGDKWSARFLKTSGISRGTPAWSIVSAPDGRIFRDNLADAQFILHLLDTIKTYQFSDLAPEGALSSYGLDPPRYALRFKAQNQEFEIRIGQRIEPEKADSPTFFSLPALYSSIPRVLLGKGALIQMLDYLKTFDTMRHFFLLTWLPDEIDQIEINAEFAQREGDDWTNRKHRRLKSDFTSFLEQLTHARVLSFIDDPAQEQKLINAFKKSNPNSSIKITLTSRTQKSLLLTLYKNEGKFWATLNSREGVFQIYEKTFDTVQNLLRNWTR